MLTFFFLTRKISLLKVRRWLVECNDIIHIVGLLVGKGPELGGGASGTE